MRKAKKVSRKVRPVVKVVKRDEPLNSGAFTGTDTQGQTWLFDKNVRLVDGFFFPALFSEAVQHDGESS